MLGLSRLISLLAVLICVSGPHRTEAQVLRTEVDLALVIAVDVSSSMDPDEQVLQRRGFAEAFRSLRVHGAIRKGAVGRIAVAYLEWSSVDDQHIALPWTVLDGHESLLAFADEIAARPLRRGQLTSISGAIDAGVRLFDNIEFEAIRKVIDISGDGINNQGRPLLIARDEAVARGVTINGLPIMTKKPEFDADDLSDYYKDCVIGGVGAFVVPVRSREEFRQAIQSKILMEVSGVVPPEPLVKTVQHELRARTDCSGIENRWRDRLRLRLER